MSREREKFEEIGKKIKRDADAASYQMVGRRQIAGPSGTLNTITPCAACKLLRRRCAQECPFSPYFSPHEPLKFASVHKVFGASNVSKMLMEVPESQRADAANSLVYEANVRLRDPVYGCMGAISALQQQVQALQSDLNAVRAELIKYKHGEANIIPPSHIALLTSAAVSIASPQSPPRALPQPPQTPPAPPPPPPPAQPPPLLPPTSSSSIYAHPAGSAMDFGNISSEHSPYFG